jgi:hypothetical protein
VLAAKKEGKFTIGAASIQVGNKLLNTKPFAIEVGKGSGQAAPQGGGNNTAKNSNFFIFQVLSNLTKAHAKPLFLGHHLHWFLL